MICEILSWLIHKDLPTHCLSRNDLRKIILTFFFEYCNNIFLAYPIIPIHIYVRRVQVNAKSSLFQFEQISTLDLT